MSCFIYLCIVLPVTLFSCFKECTLRLFFSFSLSLIVSFFIFRTVCLSVPGKKRKQKNQFVVRKWKPSTVFISKWGFFCSFFFSPKHSDEFDMPTHLTQPQQITIHSTALASQILLWCVTQPLFIFYWANSLWSAHCHGSVYFIYTNNVFKRYKGP